MKNIEKIQNKINSAIILLLLFLISCESKHYLHEINPDLKKGDTSNMVLIPASEFIMGSNNWIEKGSEERKVYLKDYYIDKYEVSNRDYNTCVKEKVCVHGSYYGLEGFNEPNKPVTGVGYDEALIYCKWLNKRLPTEEEWEKAARGTDGRKYPWGNEEINCNSASYGNGWNYECKDINPNHPVNVNSFEKSVSPYGVYNMSGNVWEWTSSDYIVKYFHKPDKANVFYKTIKGGSYGSGKEYLYTYSRRWERHYQKTIGTGFRCVMDVPQ